MYDLELAGEILACPSWLSVRQVSNRQAVEIPLADLLGLGKAVLSSLLKRLTLSG
jgi:hypothetical protein